MEEEMMDGSIWIADVALRIASLLGLVVSVSLVYIQMRKTQDWNRRKATQDLAMASIFGELGTTRRILQTTFGVDPRNAEQTYDSVCAGISEQTRSEFEYLARNLFNYYEMVAVGMKNNVLDEEICYDHLGLAFTVYWRWGSPHIKRCRVDFPTVFIEWEYYVNRWDDAYKGQKGKLRRPGKRPT